MYICLFYILSYAVVTSGLQSQDSGLRSKGLVKIESLLLSPVMFSFAKLRDPSCLWSKMVSLCFAL